MTLSISRTPQMFLNSPDSEVLDYMECQAKLFEQMKPELLTQYLNQYVWFENGQILDSDISHEALVLRAYGDGGDWFR